MGNKKLNGVFNLYINKLKFKPNAMDTSRWPDLKGYGLDLDGFKIRVGGFLSFDENGELFISCTIKDIEGD